MARHPPDAQSLGDHVINRRDKHLFRETALEFGFSCQDLSDEGNVVDGLSILALLDKHSKPISMLTSAALAQHLWVALTEWLREEGQLERVYCSWVRVTPPPGTQSITFSATETRDE